MYTILYVDDEPGLLDLGKLYLKKHWGFSVTTAESADDALKLLKTGVFDAIISDYDMPGMDGISFLKHLRSKAFFEPFILFTGKGREEIVIEALNNGADYYVQKGGDPESQYSELVNMVKMAVEKKRVEEELRQANLLSFTIINHLPDPTFVVDIKGKIIAWNNAMGKITGITAQKVLGKDVNEFFLKRYGIHNFPLVNVYLNPDQDLTISHSEIKYEDGPVTAETKIIDTNGKEIILWVKVTPLYDKNMQISGAIETIRDITNIKQAERNLRETNQQLQDIINFIPDPTFVIDKQRKVIAWNHAIEDLTGTYASSILGEGNYAYSLPFYDERRPILIDLFFEDNQNIRGSYKFVKTVDNNLIAGKFFKTIGEKKGVYLWGIAAPLYDSQGILTGAIESIRDITVIKALEFELNQRYEDLAKSYEEIAAQNEEIKASINEMAEREVLLVKSENQFRSLTENLPYGIIIHNNGKIKYANPKAVTILGYDNQEELVEKSALNIIRVDKREDISQRIIDSNNFHTGVIEEIFLKRDGTEIPVEISGISYIIDSKRTNMTIFRDITRECDRRKDFRQARKKLDILASITRHDLKNQISILVSTLDLLSYEELSEQSLSLIRYANICCQNICDNIKTTEEYHTLGLQEPKWFRIKDLIIQAINKCQLSDILDYTGSEYEIFADPLIGRVIDNLIDNSLRHGGDVNKISINVIKKTDGLLIIYKDNGNGILDDEKERIFIRGYGKNTGLGLFLISEILSVTGITIKENGKYGEGATFEIMVPHEKWRNFEQMNYGPLYMDEEDIQGNIISQKQ